MSNKRGKSEQYEGFSQEDPAHDECGAGHRPSGGEALVPTRGTGPRIPCPEVGSEPIQILEPASWSSLGRSLQPGLGGSGSGSAVASVVGGEVAAVCESRHEQSDESTASGAHLESAGNGGDASFRRP